MGCLGNIKKRKRTCSLAVSKRKRKLLAYNPTEDPQRRLEQMASLATALKASGTEYSDGLTYRPGMALRSANCAALENGGMQVMTFFFNDFTIFIKKYNICKNEK